MLSIRRRGNFSYSKMKIVILASFLLFSVSIFAQTEDTTRLKKANQELATNHKSGNFDEALKSAREVVSLSERVYGSDHFETAVANENLGIIFQNKKKFTESLKYLNIAAAIFEKDVGKYKKKIVDLLARIAYVSYLDGNKVTEEAGLKRTTEFASKQFGEESKENLIPVLSLGNFYSRTEKFDLAYELFLNSYAIAVKAYGKQSPEIERIDDSVTCAKFRDETADKDKRKLFDEKRHTIFDIRPNDIHVLNGRALTLPKPDVGSAMELGYRGKVIVKITIDEDGNVIYAKALCNIPGVLSKASEQAALKATFSPTEIDGKRVKVTGAITYSFK